MRDFLCSPCHNRRPEVLSLYDYIESALNGEGGRLEKEKVWAALFPGKPFEDKQLRYLRSFLYRSVETFLIWQELERERTEAQLFLLRALRRRRLEKPFRKALQRTRNWNDRDYLDSDQYELTFRVEQESYLFSAGGQRQGPSRLPHLNQTLDRAFLLRRLRQSCLLAAHRAIYQEEEDGGLLPVLLAYLPGSALLSDPLIGIYYYYLQAEREPENDDHYRSFRSKLLALDGRYAPVERRDALLLAINYGIRRFNQGDESFLREVFGLYQLGLESALLLDEGRLSRFAFKNIVGIGLRLLEFDWTETFIREFSSFLPKQLRDNYIHFSFSKLRFAQGRYDEAQLRLTQVEYDDLFLNLDAKIMLMKIYFEKQEYEALESHLASLYRFIRRRRKLGYHREAYLRIIRYARRLLTLNPYDPSAREELRREIRKEPALVERAWFLSKL